MDKRHFAQFLLVSTRTGMSLTWELFLWLAKLLLAQWTRALYVLFAHKISGCHGLAGECGFALSFIFIALRGRICVLIFCRLCSAQQISCPWKQSYTASSLFPCFCIPGHAALSVRWLRQSQYLAAVSLRVPRASCRHPLDWMVPSVSEPQSWGFTCRIWLGGWGPMPHGHSSE